MELDGVFLDLYGTLTSGDRQAVETTCEQIILKTGVTITAQELSITWGNRFLHSLDACNGEDFVTLFDLEKRTLVETMTEMNIDVDPAPFAEMLKQYWRNPPLQPEVLSFIAEFKYPLFIVSNADQADAEAALGAYGIEVEGILTSELARVYKPHPRIFDLALEQTGWRRERVIHVGDSLHSDVGGAIAAGIRSGWLNRTHRIHDVGTHDPDHEFGDLSEFAAWVRG